eukprot:gene22300-18227_t
MCGCCARLLSAAERRVELPGDDAEERRRKATALLVAAAMVAICGIGMLGMVLGTVLAAWMLATRTLAPGVIAAFATGQRAARADA